MTHLNRLSLVLALTLVKPLASAGPPASSSRPAISAANADQVHRISELEKRVDKIALGPGPGEMVFVDWKRRIVEVVDEANFRPLRTIADGRRPGDFALSKDGRFVTWLEPDLLVYVVQDVANGKTFEIDAGKHPGGAGFSPDGKLLAIGNADVIASDLEAGYCEIKIWDTTGRLVRTLEGSVQGGLTPVFSPDGKLLAVGNRNDATRLFEVATSKLLHTLPRKMSHELAFSPNGKVLAVAYVDGAVALWDVDSGTMLRMQPTDADFDSTKHFTSNKNLLTLDWCPKGDVLVTAGWGGKIVLWDSNKIEKANPRSLRKTPDGLAKLKELEAPRWVVRARFTSDGSRLLSSGGSLSNESDQKVVVWAVSEE